MYYKLFSRQKIRSYSYFDSITSLTWSRLPNRKLESHTIFSNIIDILTDYSR